MGAGCDDKASAYEYTLPAARAPLGDIVDLLGGEVMIKCTQRLARPQLEMFFAFLSNTGYAQNVVYYGRNETRNSLSKRSKVNGVNETKAAMVYRLVKALSTNGNVEFGWAVEIQKKIVNEKENTLRAQAAQNKEAIEALQVQKDELYDASPYKESKKRYLDSSQDYDRDRSHKKCREKGQFDSRPLAAIDSAVKFGTPTVSSPPFRLSQSSYGDVPTSNLKGAFDM